MKTMIAVLLLLVAGFTNPPAQAADESLDGGSLYLEHCSECHGQYAEGNADIMVPVLAGYPSNYLLRQISLFLTGKRTGEDGAGRIKKMIANQNKLSANELVQITTYLAELDIPVLLQDIKPVGTRGRTLYSRNCSGCHGADASGNDAQGAPRLTGQYSWYIKSQLIGFRADHRGIHDGDKFGRQMKMMADAISTDADIDILADYVLTLSTN